MPRVILSKRAVASSGTRNVPAGLGVSTALAHGRSATIQIVGDSTGDALNEWFALLGGKLADKFAGANLVWRKWNDATQTYNPPEVLREGGNGPRYATLTNASAQFVAPAIAGDLDVVARLRPVAWASGAAQVFAARWETTSNQRAFYTYLTGSGFLGLSWSADGSTILSATSSAAAPFAADADGWVRVTLDVDNGAAGSTVTFYTSTDGVTWAQLGAPVVTAGVTSLFASTAPYQVGSYGSAIVSPFAGRAYWVEIRNGLAGRTMVPPLLDDWEMASSSLSNTNVPGGSPTILLLCGAQSGQGLAYHNDTTRRPKVLAQHGQKLIIVSTGHNDSGANTNFITNYAAYIVQVKAAFPGVPILSVTQNPVKSPMSEGAIAIRAARGVALMTWAAFQTGVYGLDTYPAFTDLSAQLFGDGLHPNDAGSEAWAQFAYSALFA